MSKKKNIQSFQRAASFIPSTYNESENTVELVAATESEVLTYNWDYGRVREILSMDKGHVRMDRLKKGAQLLDNHNSFGSIRNAVLGVVEEARIENKQLIVRCRFSGREDLKDFIQDVKNGIYQNVSIQYRIYKAEVTEEDGKLPVLRAVDWEPFEVSFVSVPADYNAGARKQSDEPTYECEIINTRNSNFNTMKASEILKLVRAAGLDIAFAQTLIDTESITEDKVRSMIDAEKLRLAGTHTPAPAPAPAANPAPVADDAAVRNAQRAEKKRSSEIINAVRAAGFDLAYAQELIDDENMTADNARAAILNKMATTGSQAQQQRNTTSPLAITADETDKRRAVMIDGLVLRSAEVKADKFKPEQVSAAREFRGMTLLDVAKDCLVRSGMSQKEINAMSKMDIVGRAFTSSTSDFPTLLEGTNRRVLLENYQAIADTWRQFCMTGTVSDFREHKRLRMGSFSRLDEVKENAEFKNKSIPDAEFESIAAKTYGNIINVSRQMIVNDDLNAFTRLTAMLGRAAARSIEIDVYALLASNPTLEDGVALFHATHNNLSSGAITVANLDAMRVLMAKQKDPSNNDFLDLRPSTLLIGIGQGSTARMYNDSQYDPDASNKLQKPNTVRGLFSQIVDTARITGTEHYAFANPNEEPVIEVAFLDGVQTPFMDQEQGFTVDGMKWKVRLDYGVGAIGYRGAVKTTGA